MQNLHKSYRFFSTFNLSVKFINEAQQPASGIIKVVDFIVTNDNGFPTLLDNLTYPLSNQYSASSWITLPYEKATIAAQDIVRVNFKTDIRLSQFFCRRTL